MWGYFPATRVTHSPLKHRHRYRKATSAKIFSHLPGFAMLGLPHPVEAPRRRGGTTGPHAGGAFQRRDRLVQRRRKVRLGQQIDVLNVSLGSTCWSCLIASQRSSWNAGWGCFAATSTSRSHMNKEVKLQPTKEKVNIDTDDEGEGNKGTAVEIK